MDKITELLGSIFALAVSVAIIAILVSKKSQTPAVIQSWFSGNANLLAVAASPVTGSKVNIDTSYPSTGILGSVGDLNFGSSLDF
ncbi:MAG: hypothetical protein AB7K41_14480 [Bdellovibrionales bacterium]